MVLKAHEITPKDRIPNFSLAHRQKRESVAPGKLTFTVKSFVPC